MKTYIMDIDYTKSAAGDIQYNGLSVISASHVLAHANTGDIKFDMESLIEFYADVIFFHPNNSIYPSENFKYYSAEGGKLPDIYQKVFG